MALIPILDKDGVSREVEASELVRRNIRTEYDERIEESVEFWFPDDPERIVHRSAQVTYKKWPHGMDGETGKF